MVWWYNDSYRYGAYHGLGIDKLLSFASANYDIRESESGLFLEIDLPGAKNSDLKVETVSNLVKICGKRKGKDFFYDYSLDKSYDPSTGVAKLENGVLTLTFNKHELQKPKVHTIQVK
jgi:HSP20 family molecular chaperone IbpA